MTEKSWPIGTPLGRLFRTVINDPRVQFWWCPVHRKGSVIWEGRFAKCGELGCTLNNHVTKKLQSEGAYFALMVTADEIEATLWDMKPSRETRLMNKTVKMLRERAEAFRAGKL